MKILVVSQYFRPESFRINDIVDWLVHHGHEVSVLTGFPNYPEGYFVKGFGVPRWTRSFEGEVEVFRVPIISRGSGSPLRLALNYLSFVLSGLLSSIFFLRNRNVDLVFCYAPSPIIQALVGIWYSKIKRCKFILNVQDLWPESVTHTTGARSPAMLAVIDSVVKLIYRSSDLLLVSSEPFRPIILQKCPKANVIYWPNSVSPIFYTENMKSTKNDFAHDEIVIVFAGNLGSVQHLDLLVGAAEILRHRNDIFFDVYGTGSKATWLADEKRTRKLSNLRLYGKRPVAEMPAVFGSASALLISLVDAPIFRATVPNKLQAYMASGRPIIGCISGEGARLIRKAEAGFVVDEMSPAGLARAVEQLAACSIEQRMTFGVNGYDFFVENFEHLRLMKKLDSFFTEMAELR